MSIKCVNVFFEQRLNKISLTDKTMLLLLTSLYYNINKFVNIYIFDSIYILNKFISSRVNRTCNHRVYSLTVCPTESRSQFRFPDRV